MNQSNSISSSPIRFSEGENTGHSMKRSNLLFSVIVGSSAYVVFCAAMVLLIEAKLVSMHQSFFHASQFPFVFVCFFTGACYLYIEGRARKGRFVFVSIATILSAAWLAFYVFVIVTLMHSPSMD